MKPKSDPLNKLPVSAFGDMRMIELSPQFQESFEYTVDNTEKIANTVVGSGTVTQANAMAVVSTGTTSASTAQLESKRHAKYRPGLGGVMRFTALFTTPVATTTQCVGIMDETGSSEIFKNGYAIGFNGTSFGFHRFANDALTTVQLSDWDDPLDGCGKSGMTLDPTKLNVWFIQFQYLGAGAINLWVEDQNTGKMFICHTIDYANLNIEPSVFNPNFHFQIYVDNAATTNDLIVKSCSYAYFIEGFTELKELHQTQFSSEKQSKALVTTEVPILTIRNKANYAGKKNFIDILFEYVSVSIEANSANNLGEVRLIRNASLTGASFSDINTSNSIAEIDTSATSFTGGKEVFPIELAGKNDKEAINIIPFKVLVGELESLTLAGSSANSATVNAAVLWKELT